MVSVTPLDFVPLRQGLSWKLMLSLWIGWLVDSQESPISVSSPILKAGFSLSILICNVNEPKELSLRSLGA